MQLTRLAALTAAAFTAVTVATIAQPAGATTPTQKIVLRPVTSIGHVASGYTMKNVPGRHLLDCSGDEVSPVAVNNGIFACSPSAAYAVACWHASSAHHVLCYQNPFGTKVDRYAANAPAHAKFPREAKEPFALVLDDGNQCTIRDGGAWPSPTQHPKWVGYYSCTGKDSAVWASLQRSKTGGINEAHARWTVYTGKVNKALTKHAISKAYFVGTQRV
jgi:hypothetical protein